MSRTDISKPFTVDKGTYTSTTWTDAYRNSSGVLVPAVPRKSTVYNNFGYRLGVSESRSSVSSAWPAANLSAIVRPFSYAKEEVGYLRESRLSYTRATLTGPGNNWTLDEGYLRTDTTSPLAWHVPAYLVIPQSEIDAMDRELRTALLNKSKDQKFNAQQFLAEREQTIRLLTETIKSVSSLIHNLKRGNIVGAMNAVGITVGKRARRKFNHSYARNQSKAIANGWIKAQYGVRPLMQDIVGAAESLAKILNAKPPVYHVEVHKAIKRSSDTTSVINPDYVRNVHRISTTEYHMKYGVYFTQDLNVSSVPTSLGLTNPLSIVWELTPWSFVIDWFLPIGNFLSSLDATVGLTFQTGYKTTFVVSRARMDCWSINQPYGTSTTILEGKGVSYKQSISNTRTVLNAFPLPGLPVFKNPLSLVHMANAFSLLRQQFR